MAFNKVIIMGNLVRDPELHKTPEGKSVCTITVAVNRRAGTDGKTETDFFTVVNWNRTAEFVVRFFQKGSSILICGRLQNRSWEDKNGNKRIVTEILSDEVTFGEKKVASASEPGTSEPVTCEPEQEVPTIPSYGPLVVDNGLLSFDDDELPF